MKSFVRLYDTVSITPSSVDLFTKTVADNLIVSPTNSLRVDIVATHAARLTRNNGFYLPQKMKEGVSSLLEPYGKPMLVHHDSSADPVGRIVGAQYTETILQSFKHDSVLDSALKSLLQPNLPFIRAIPLIDQIAESELLQDPNYPGLGHILITVDVTDPDAIRKVLDKRYLTVSIGASTDKAVCSICKQDWVEEGPCEHKPGKLYDGKMAFIVAGKLMYDEVSFVNVPADSLARVISIHNGVTTSDSVVVEESRQTCHVNATFFFTDSQLSGGTPVAEPEDKTDKTTTETPVVAVVVPEVVTPAVAPEPVKDEVVVPAETPAAIPDPVVVPEKTEDEKRSEEMAAFKDTLQKWMREELKTMVSDSTASSSSVSGDKAKDEQIAALRQEIDDLTNEAKQQQSVHMDQLKSLKSSLAVAVVQLDSIVKKTVDNFEKLLTDTASLSLEDLLKKANELKDSVDTKTIVTKLNDGTARVPVGTVEDPTATSQLAGNQEPDKSDSSAYIKTYNQIKSVKGLADALEFVRKLIEAGLVPNGFNPETVIKGGSV